jgi:NAD(P)-dependent dehydrogenase (short-subunit alcohol dehydrogenase family)
VARLTGRVVAITGASAGIGRATAERLAAEGAAVAVLARRRDALDDLVGRIVAGGGRALAVPGDVTEHDDLSALVARSVDAYGRLDAMVANAGIGYHGTLGDTPVGVMRRLVDVNLMGTFYAAQAALSVFRRQGHGHFVAVSSIVGRRGIGGSAVYGATKAAQIGLVESLRADFVGTNLHASLVYPIGTDTEFREAIRRDYGQEVTIHGPQQTSDQVARAIVECLVSPTAEVYPYRRSKLLAVLNVIAPAQADRFVKRFGRSVKPKDTTP